MTTMQLFPRLPDDVAHSILARLPCSDYALLRSVCRAWWYAMRPSVMTAPRTVLRISQPWLLLRSNSRIIVVDPLLGSMHEVSLPGVSGMSITLRDFHPMPVMGTLHHISPIPAPGFSESFCLDLASMQVKLVRSLIPRPIQHVAHYASAMMDGFVFVAGGICCGDASNSVQRLDTKTMTWQSLPDMHKCRIGAKGLILQGHFYVIGGEDEQGRRCLDGEMWDPKTGEWTLIPELSPPYQSDHCFSPLNHLAVVKDKLYALIGFTFLNYYDIRRYDITTKRWSYLGIIRPGARGLVHLLQVCEELVVIAEEKDIESSKMVIWTSTPTHRRSLYWETRGISLKKAFFIEEVMVIYV